MTKFIKIKHVGFPASEGKPAVKGTKAVGTCAPGALPHWEKAGYKQIDEKGDVVKNPDTLDVDADVVADQPDGGGAALTETPATVGDNTDNTDTPARGKRS